MLNVFSLNVFDCVTEIALFIQHSTENEDIEKNNVIKFDSPKKLTFYNSLSNQARNRA